MSVELSLSISSLILQSTSVTLQLQYLGHLISECGPTWQQDTAIGSLSLPCNIQFPKCCVEATLLQAISPL
ncbi:hypothetical protein BDD12DRAFT_850683 [Trichophaea hybrida]|nr:hypothetical protein BDD12DRAFT_850683 [Trichophaea hybrida]